MTLDISPFQMIMMGLSWLLGFAISKATAETKAKIKKLIPTFSMVLAAVTQLVEKAAVLVTPETAPVAPAFASFASMYVATPILLWSPLALVLQSVVETLVQTWIVTGAHSWQKNTRQAGQREVSKATA